MENTMGKKEYIVTYFVGTFVFMIGFVKLFFRCIPECTYIQTWIIFIGLFFGVSGIGIVITFDRGRNYHNLIQNLILAFGTFVFVAYWDLFSTKMVWILLIASIFSLVCSLLILIRKITKPERRKKIIKIRLYRCVECARRNFAVAFLIIMIPIGFKMLYTGTLLSAVVVALPTYGDEYSMDANMDMLINLQEEKFQKLSIEERLELSKVICLVEAKYLGLNTEINVCASDLAEGTLAYYNDSRHIVCVDIEVLQGSSCGLVKRLAHEMFHSYQHRLTDSYLELNEETRDLLIYREIAEYRAEMEDYKSGSDGTMESYFEYYTQNMERDAREYSDRRVEEYFEKIEEYKYIKENSID